MKVLISCIFFQRFTGSEMYVYELAKNLVKEGCDVSVVSQHTSGPLVEIAKKDGIKVFNLSEPPRRTDFDIIHCQHTPITQAMISLYPTIKKICTIHSEVIDLENPVKHESIKKYIAIRPEIKNHIVEKFGIPDNMVEIIYNPINSDRFNTKNTKKENYLLFVGSLEHLRKKPLYDLVEYTKHKKMELWVVGSNHSNYLQDILKNPHVKYFEPLENVENFVKNCSETGGILLGRTTIEGWMCGKPGWIYNVNQNGEILDKNYYEPPSDIDKFDSNNVTKEIKKIYINALNL